jgi:hypothetical protein
MRASMIHTATHTSMHASKHTSMHACRQLDSTHDASKQTSMHACRQPYHTFKPHEAEESILHARLGGGLGRPALITWKERVFKHKSLSNAYRVKRITWKERVFKQQISLSICIRRKKNLDKQENKMYQQFWPFQTRAWLLGFQAVPSENYILWLANRLFFPTCSSDAIIVKVPASLFCSRPTMGFNFNPWDLIEDLPRSHWIELAPPSHNC